MKTISANFRIEIRNVQTEVEDNASVNDCFNALKTEVQNSLLWRDSVSVECLKSSEKELCPNDVGPMWFFLPFRWAEIQIEKFSKKVG